VQYLSKARCYVREVVHQHPAPNDPEANLGRRPLTYEVFDEHFRPVGSLHSDVKNPYFLLPCGAGPDYLWGTYKNASLPNEDTLYLFKLQLARKP
jgi:hypothetical protein